MDLADGHVKALDKMSTFSEVMTINLGTGKGYSVLEVLKAFEAACGKKVPYSIAPRRAGDIATCFADPTYAKAVLGWEAQRGIDEMCKDSWRWQSNNPNGYKESNA
jgi:UDP-glucose 4-epimerase